MTLDLTVSHTTRQTYTEPVPYGLLQARLTPKPRPDQEVLSWRITVAGGQIETSYTDQHLNPVTLISVLAGGSELEITCAGVVRVTDRAGVVGPHRGGAPLWLFERTTPLTRPGPAVRRLVKTVEQETQDSDPVARLHALSDMVAKTVRYEAGRTDAATSAEQAADAGHGVCQDHAHVFIAAARAMGYPARYVSGHLMLEDRADQQAGHAWAEAHADGLGWVGFDVSNEICPDARYIRVATGLDYQEAAPLTGPVPGPAVAALEVAVAVSVAAQSQAQQQQN